MAETSAPRGQKPKTLSLDMDVRYSGPEVFFSIDNPKATAGTLAIFTVSGRLVAEVPWTGSAEDSPEIRWSGVSRGGQSVATGIYLAKATFGNRAGTARFVHFR